MDMPKTLPGAENASAQQPPPANSADTTPEHQLVVCAYHGLSMLEYGAAIDIFAGHRTADAP